MKNINSIILVMMSLLVQGCFDTKAESEGKLLSKNVLEKLKETGDHIAVSDVYPSEWDKVCYARSMSTGGMVTKESLAKRFSIKVEDVILPNGEVWTSDENWALYFVDYPNIITGLHMDNRDSGGQIIFRDEQEKYPYCFERDNALFALEVRFSGKYKHPYITLLSKEYLENGKFEFDCR